MKIKCIAQDATVSHMFTVGKTYDVTEQFNNNITVIDNLGYLRTMGKGLRFIVENNSSFDGDDIRRAYFELC